MNTILISDSRASSSHEAMVREGMFSKNPICGAWGGTLEAGGGKAGAVVESASIRI